VQKSVFAATLYCASVMLVAAI